MMVRTLPQATSRLLLQVLAAFSLAECSTVLRGTSQAVAIDTPGVAGATCQVTGGDGINATVVTPGSIRVSKSKRDILVACVASDGRQASTRLASTYSNASYVQLPQAYLIDGISGAMWEYPATLAVPFAPPGDARAGVPAP